MGAANFAYNVRLLDVLHGSCVSDFDVAAHNAELQAFDPESEPIAHDDWDYIAEQVGVQINAALEDMHASASASQPYTRSGIHAAKHKFSVGIRTDLDQAAFDSECRAERLPHAGRFLFRVDVSHDVKRVRNPRGADDYISVMLCLWVSAVDGYHDGVQIVQQPVLSVGNYSTYIAHDEHLADFSAAVCEEFADNGMNQARADWLARVSVPNRLADMMEIVMREYTAVVRPYIDTYTAAARASSGETAYTRADR